MKFFDDTSKRKLKWWNRNYFFAGTFTILLLTILSFCLLKKYFSLNDDFNMSIVIGDNQYYVDKFRFYQLITYSFVHGSVGHIVGNMITLGFVGLWLERKCGSFSFFVLYLLMSIVAGGATVIAFKYNVMMGGASGVISCIYGLFFITMLFDFKNMFKEKVNLIVNIFCCIAILTAMWIPIPGLTTGSDILHKQHLAPFIAGIIVGSCFYITKFITTKIKTQKGKING